MRATKNNTNSRIGGCLLHQANSLSESAPSSFENGKLTWEASILPLSYTRLGYIL